MNNTDNNGVDENGYRNRKVIRAEFHNYSHGMFFVTICTYGKQPLFGHIADGEITYTPMGIFAIETLQLAHVHYPYADVTEFIVMPNHVHAIVRILTEEESEKSLPEGQKALGIVVGGIKSRITTYARRNEIYFKWQSRYHDRIIRNPEEGAYIIDYIRNNVSRWESDCFGPAKLGRCY